MEISDYWSYRDTAVAFSKLREAEQLIGGNSEKRVQKFLENIFLRRGFLLQSETVA